MPIAWTLEPNGRYVVFSVVNPWTMDEWREAAGAVINAPFANPRVPILVDRRHSEPLTTHAVDEIVRFASQHEEVLAGRRVSILVTDDVNFGMGRMTVQRAEVALPKTAMRTFRNYEDAVDWLVR